MTRSSYKLPYTAGFLDKKVKENFFFIPKQSKQAYQKKELQPIKQGSGKALHNIGYKDPIRPTFAFSRREGEQTIKVYQRSSTIIPEMIGAYVKIHTGQKFVNFQITEHTIGYKFGEFALTKKRALYKRKKKR